VQALGLHRSGTYATHCQESQRKRTCQERFDKLQLYDTGGWNPLLYPSSNAVQRRSHSINKRLGRINITRNIKHVNHVYQKSMSMLKFAIAMPSFWKFPIKWFGTQVQEEKVT
jgi:hypothetical protein